MGEVCRGLKEVVTYVDDAIAASANHDDHLKTLQELAARFRAHGLKLNIKKCFFGRKEVAYLGFHVSQKGIAPDPTKLEAIKKMQPPKTLRGVQEVLGLFNFFRGLIPNFSTLTAPLSYLTSKAAGYNGGPLPEPAYKAFRQLQSLLCSKPIAAFPDPTKGYKIYVDAAQGSENSPGGLGAILTQEGPDGQDHMISCFSRALREHERNHSAFAIERLGVEQALDYFREFIIARPVVVYTDHAPVVGHSKRHQKTISELQQKIAEFDADIRYVFGRENTAADALSRNVLPIAGAAAVSTESTPLPIVEAQQKDKETKSIYDFLTKKQLPEDRYLQQLISTFASKCVVRDNVVYIIEQRRGQMPKSRVWVPPSLRQSIMQQEHGSVLSGHWKSERTFQRVLANHFWPTMAKDVSEYVEKCPICYTIDDHEAKKTRYPLQPWPQSTAFNQRVHIDLVGPLKSSGDKRYICVLIDSYSKWVQLAAIKEKTAEVVASTVYKKWICEYSPPHVLVSDGGKEFANALMKQLLRLLGSKQKVITPLHPIANGQVERFNRSLKAYLTSFVDDDTLNWEEFLEPLKFAHNTSVSRSTMHTPFYLLFTHDPTMPWALTNPNRNSIPMNANGDRFRAMLKAREIVMKTNEDARRAYEEYYNRKATTRSLDPGDMVLVHFPNAPPGTNRKLWRPWQGNYRVVRQLDKGVVMVLKDGKPEEEAEPIHINRIKLHHEFFDAKDIAIDIPKRQQAKHSHENNADVMTEDLRHDLVPYLENLGIQQRNPSTPVTHARNLSEESSPTGSQTPEHLNPGPGTPAREEDASSNSSLEMYTPPANPDPEVIPVEDTPVNHQNPLDKVAKNLFPIERRTTRFGGEPQGKWDFSQGGHFRRK